MLGSLKLIAGSFVPLSSPSFCNATGVPGGVNVRWAEVPGATFYQVFESLKGAYGTGSQIAAVTANKGGQQNAFLRVGLPDLNKRFYYVIPVNQFGIPGNPSSIAASAATSLIVGSVQLDSTINGLFAKPLQTTISPTGQIDLASTDTINKGEVLFKQLSLFGAQPVTAGNLLLPDAILSVNLGSRFPSPNLGLNPNWVMKQGVIGAGSGSFRGIVGGSDFRASAYFKNSGFGSNQFARIILQDGDIGSNNYVGPAINMDPAVESYYAAGWHGLSQQIELIKIVAGGVTVMSSQSQVMNSGDALYIENNSGTINVKINGNTVLSVVDAALSGGNVGIHTAQSDSTSQVGTTFTAGDLTSGATVSDNFVAIFGAKPVIILATLVFQTDATANDAKVSVFRDSGQIITAMFDYVLPVSSTRTVTFMYPDIGVQTSGPGGAVPPPITPGSHMYQLQIGTTAGTLTLLDGYFMVLTPAG